jgi:hypothetical protein
VAVRYLCHCSYVSGRRYISEIITVSFPRSSLSRLLWPTYAELRLASPYSLERVVAVTYAVWVGAFSQTPQRMTCSRRCAELFSNREQPQ